jgi:hypothetical protein
VAEVVEPQGLEPARATEGTQTSSPGRPTLSLPPLVSVVIPTRNRPKTPRLAVRSAFEQDGADWPAMPGRQHPV